MNLELLSLITTVLTVFVVVIRYTPAIDGSDELATFVSRYPDESAVRGI